MALGSGTQSSRCEALGEHNLGAGVKGLLEGSRKVWGSQGWRLGKASVGKGVDEREALGVRMSVEGWGMYLEVIRDGGQRGDVGHRVKCGVKGLGSLGGDW